MTTVHHSGHGPAARAIDALLLDLASAQEGILTTAQLRAAGLDARTLVALVRSGTLVHPGRGLYVVAALERHEPEARHRQLAVGAMLLYPDAVLVSATALLAHGVPVWGAPLTRPQLRRHMSRSGGMSAFWVRPSPGPSVPTAGGPASTVAESLALHAIDHGIESGVVSADAALHRGLVSPDELTVAVDGVAGWVHGSRAVAMRSLADGRRESVRESRCGIALEVGGIRLVPQVEIVDGRGRLVGRVDFLVDGTRVVVEFDGKVKYQSGEPAVLWAEKRREDELRALGYVVVRITWADLERPGAVVAKVRAALALAS